MSIIELGALGEFVGAFGVIATLIYLTIQVRQNTELARANIDQQLTIASQNARLSSIHHYNLISLGVKAESGERLERDEWEAFRTDIGVKLEVHQDYYVQWKRGLRDYEHYRSKERELLYQLKRWPVYKEIWDWWKPVARTDFAGQIEARLAETPDSWQELV